jgi:alpha-amylase/alpha-mannosidase (GH57 family)
MFSPLKRESDGPNIIVIIYSTVLNLFLRVLIIEHPEIYMNLPKDDLQKYLCIHGHFYQPPRENPWLNIIECQESAFPYHDWNERITRECYGPNTCGRLHGKEGRILKLVNNYMYMSFNFGPTLLTWLEESYPRIYQKIIDADSYGRDRYSGHGNALAQVYNHIIMPLASTRDKLTQIRWGLEDFKHRFGRDPEGMWLAETAVDTEILKLMAGEGIRFTILSPDQAMSVRPLSKGASTTADQTPTGKDSDSDPWEDVSVGLIDPTQPYRVVVDKARDLFIDVFFYHGPLSRAIAYEKILSSGEALLARIKDIFNNHSDGPRLVSIATDGESYGHHFKFVEMALSWLFDHMEKNLEIKLTNYGQFLEMSPPVNEVKIFENSSWSCPHGVERWRTDCGCSVGRNPAWNQSWRRPLRDGLNWLADELNTVFEDRAGRLLKDPWEARDKYIDLILDQSETEKNTFLHTRAIRELSDDNKLEIFKLMESQRMGLYMFTSCGWFFDDISGIETTQILKYALRAVDLVRPWAGDLESGLRDFLIKAESNKAVYKHGKDVYQILVKPSRIDETLLAAHYGFICLVRKTGMPAWLPGMINVLWEKEIDEKGITAIVGEVDVVEKTTGERFRKVYVAVIRDWGNLVCLVGNSSGLEANQLVEEIRAGLLLSSQEDRFEIDPSHISHVRRFYLKDLISDTRKWVINGLAHNLYCQIRDSIGIHVDPLHSLASTIQEAGESVPPSLDTLLGMLFVDNLLDMLAMDHGGKPIDFDPLTGLKPRLGPTSQDPSAENRPGDFPEQDTSKQPILKQEAQKFLRRQMDLLAETKNTVFLKNIINFLTFAGELDMHLDLWECQNHFYELTGNNDFLDSLPPDGKGLFQELGRLLGFVMGD